MGRSPTLLALPDEVAGVAVIETARIEDERGFLCELTSRRGLAARGIEADWVQDNFSLSPRAPTLRGLHFQHPPHGQAKLVRVLRGAAFTVGVDLRSGSATRGRHVALTLSAERWQALYLPVGFAHGLVTLLPDTEVLYKVDAYHAPDHAAALAWDDPALGVAWPVDRASVLVSAKDRAAPGLAALGWVFP